MTSPSSPFVSTSLVGIFIIPSPSARTILVVLTFAMPLLSRVGILFVRIASRVGIRPRQRHASHGPCPCRDAKHGAPGAGQELQGPHSCHASSEDCFLLSAVTPGPGLHVRGPSSLGEASARRPGDARASDSLSSSLGAAFAFDAVAVTRGRAGGSAAGSARCGCGSSSSVQYEYEPSSSSFGFLFLSLPPMAPAEVRTTKNKLNATKSRNNML